MGFHRLGAPAALDRAAARAVITRFVADDLAFAARMVDPFGIDHDCINPSGHEVIASCGEVVCAHCSRIF
jgi:hypothetical protein